ELSRPVRAAVVAAVVGIFVAADPADPFTGLAAGATAVTVVFVLLGWALDAQGFAPALRSVATVTRRLAHAVFH
ncbi:murein biosynthesis protein MurJ, partial [Streptomyces hyaluromycini]